MHEVSDCSVLWMLNKGQPGKKKGGRGWENGRQFNGMAETSTRMSFLRQGGCENDGRWKDHH